MKSLLKKYKWVIAGLGIAAAIAGIYTYSILYSSNTSNTSDPVIVFIPNQIEWQNWLGSDPQNIPIDDINAFKLTARIKGFKNIKPGRYKFKPGMSNNEIINMLRIGRQDPVRIRIDDTSNLYELAGRLGAALQNDSTQFINAFISASKYSSEGFSNEKIACLIYPDTYDFFWTMTPEEFLEKMYSYHKKYFTPEKIDLARKAGLSPQEVYILASIVKAETAKKEEAPKIAGLYLNRLRINKPLESDPTAVFAAGLDHMERVYNNVLQTESPYNTYRNSGLPPGPINFAETIYLDAVLKPESHNFLYMCAQPGNTGFHNFSTTFEQHKEYARIYRNWLNQKGIR